MNKLWLLIVTKDNKIKLQQVDVVQEHTKKYEVESKYPFKQYNFIHKHNLNIIHYENRMKSHYVIALSKEKCIEIYKEYVHQKINKYTKSVNKLIDLKQKLENYNLKGRTK